MIPYEYRKIVQEAAKKTFINTPEFITNRIVKELEFLEKKSTGEDATHTGNYWRANYLLRSLLGKKINRNTYVIDNGLNGNLLIGYLLGLSEIVPLPPFYYCSKCGHYELGPKESISGYSLTVKLCPNCNVRMRGLGVDIPLSEISLDNISSLGLRVSKTFLSNNRLNIYNSFKRKLDRRDRQSFAITISNATIKFDESFEIAIIEKIVCDREINVVDIDYNDQKVFETIFSDNKYGLHIIGSRLFQKTSDLVGHSTTFDEFICLIGFFLGPSCNSENIEQFAKKYNGIRLADLPTSREDLSIVLSEFGIDNNNASKVDEVTMRRLTSYSGSAHEKIVRGQLTDYLKNAMYFERKCTVVLKALMVYRLAYLKTYYPELFVQTINELGLSKISTIDMKRAIRQVKIISHCIGKKFSDEEYIREVAYHLKNYVDWQDHRFNEQIELINSLCKN